MVFGLGCSRRVGRIGSLHKMDYTYSKVSRTQGKLLMDNLGRDSILQRVQPECL